MERRALVLAALVLCTGCGAAPFGGDGSSTPRETFTPVPVSPTETPTGTEPPDILPPGVSSEGTVNATRLRQAHDRLLGNRSYTWTFDYEIRGSPQIDSAFDRDVSREVRVDGRRILVTQTNNLAEVDLSVYTNASAGYLRVAEDNTTRVSALDNPGTAATYVDAGTLIERFLAVTNPDITPVERGGETYYRVQSGRQAPQALGGTKASRDSVTAYITESGFIQSLIVRYDRDAGSGFQSVFLRFDYSAVGETHVGAPAWVANASSSTPTPTSAPEPDRETPTSVLEVPDQ